MKNFELYNPVNLVFGEGQMAKLKDLIPLDKKVILTYGGGSIFKNGIHQQVVEALSEHQVVEFGGIEPNPTFETLSQALELIKREKVEFILAVGGGSVIDGSKFLSAAALYEGDDAWDILAKRIRTFQGMPLGTVLTLPATGSEMNSGAVITKASTQEKLGMGGPGLFPQFSILDPNVIKSLPQRQLQNGVIDAFTHVMEQYVTYPTSADLQDRIAESVLNSLVEVGPKVIEDPTNYEVAANFMWCCTMALNGLIQKGVPTDWATHMIGHELTAFYNIDHARTLAIVGPRLYRAQFENKKEKLAQMAERVWGITEGTIAAKAEGAIQAIENFFYTVIGVPSNISDYTSETNGFAEKVKARFEERGWLAIGERQAIDLNQIEEIVANCY